MPRINLQAIAAKSHGWFGDSIHYLLRPVEILKGYERENLRSDLIAGLTIAIIMLPSSMAYALLAELPPQYGIYAAVVASIAAALWGSSNHLNTGPTNAASLLVLSTLLPIAAIGSPDYLVAAGVMAVMVGFVRMLMGLFRLGVLVNFVSDSVIVGFTAGAGILITFNQARHFLGVEIPSSPRFFTTVNQLIRHLPDTHLPSLALGAGAVAVSILIRWLRPKWPSLFITMVLAAIAVAIFHLDGTGVAVLGELPRGLPPIRKLPLLDFELLGHLSFGAFAVAAIGLVEAMSISRSIAAQSGQWVDSNQEFVGQGLANIFAGFFSGYTVSGSFMRSAVNYDTGGRSSLSSVFAGLWVLAALLVFAPLAKFLPRTALAAVLIVTAYGMINKQEIRRIWHASWGDSMIMVATFFATILLPLEFAVMAGVVASFGRYLLKTSMPEVYPAVPSDNYRHFIRREGRAHCTQLGVLTISGSLYFGAAHHVEDIIRAELEKYPEQTQLLLRMHLVDHVDVSGIHMLEAVVRLYRQKGGDVYMSGVRKAVLERMELLGFSEFLGKDNFFLREEAIAHLFHHNLSPDICIYECPFRIFAECQALPKYELNEQTPITAPFPEQRVPSWYPSDVKNFIDLHEFGDRFVLIDVREPSEFNEGHIPQAQLVPMRSIPEEGKRFEKYQVIVLVCRTGRRSQLAGAILKDFGCKEVYTLQGGILAWTAAGYPVAVE